MKFLAKKSNGLLKEKVGAVECDSPKSCFRELRLPLRLSDEEVELCLKMADDRNLSVHTYSKEMAEKLFGRIKEYRGICVKIYEKISGVG